MSAASFQLLQGDPTTWGVPPVGSTLLGINTAGVLVYVNNNGSGSAVISPVVSAAPGELAFANAAGTTTLTPATGVTTATGVVTGGARNVPIVLTTAGAQDGQTLEVLVAFPALDNLILNFYNTVGTGSPITQIQSSTAGNITTAVLKFLFQSATGLWTLISRQMPAY